MAKSKSTETAVLVTTAHKGVFFGYLNGPVTDAVSVRIERARMCVYWSANCKGVLGLAATGPLNGCRVSPAVPAITLRDVTSVFEVSDEAAKKWEEQPWN